MSVQSAAIKAAIQAAMNEAAVRTTQMLVATPPAALEAVTAPAPTATVNTIAVPVPAATVPPPLDIKATKTTTYACPWCGVRSKHKYCRSGPCADNLKRLLTEGIPYTDIYVLNTREKPSTGGARRAWRIHWQNEEHCNHSGLVHRPAGKGVPPLPRFRPLNKEEVDDPTGQGMVSVRLCTNHTPSFVPLNIVGWFKEKWVKPPCYCPKGHGVREHSLKNKNRPSTQPDNAEVITYKRYQPAVPDSPPSTPPPPLIHPSDISRYLEARVLVNMK